MKSKKKVPHKCKKKVSRISKLALFSILFCLALLFGLLGFFRLKKSENTVSVPSPSHVSGTKRLLPTGSKVSTPPAPQDSTPVPKDSVPDPQDAPPESQDSTPEPGNITPAHQDDTPDSQDTTPDSQDATPEPKDSTPEPENTTPVHQDDTPDSQDTTPDSQDTTPPEPQDTTPEPGDTTDESRDSTSDSQDSTPAPEQLFQEELNLLDGNATATRKIWEERILRSIEDRKFAVLVPLLREQILKCLPKLLDANRLNYNLYKSSRILPPSLDLCYLCDLLGTNDLHSVLQESEPGKEELSHSAFLKWLLLDKSRPLHLLMQNYALNSGDKSELSYGLNMLYSLWQRTRVNDRAKYLNLAIACSLVRRELAEQPPMLRNNTEPLLSMVNLYEYFRDADKKHDLLTDIKKLSPSDLLYVVQLRLPQSEIDYVHKKMRYRRENWGDAYASVEYMMDRATQDSDPYKTYTFSEIKELGGVCRDQAYYTAYSARCMGIPSVYITGDGDRGPHAWVGLLSSDKGWTTSGSYGYKTGRYLNPCSGNRQHESTLLDSNNRLSNDKQAIAADAMLLSSYLSDTGCAKEALTVARFVTSSFPLLTAAWRNRIATMESLDENTVGINDWKRVYSELSRLYKKNTELIDLTQDIQSRKLLEDKADWAKKAALKKENRKLSLLVNSGRMDLVYDALQRQAEIPARNGNGKELASFFKQLMKQYASRSDVMDTILSLYKNMLEVYSKALEDNKKLSEKRRSDLVQSAWRSAAKDAMDLYGKRAYESDDYFAIKKAHDIMLMIAGFWRMCGEDRRADDIEEEAETALLRAKRNSL